MKQGNESVKKAARLTQEKKRGHTLEDIGILLFLASVFVGAAVTAAGPVEYLPESLIMFGIMCGSILFAAYKFHYLAAATVGLQMLFYTVYKVFQATANHQEISWTAYVWIFIPAMASGSMILFQRLSYKIETANEILNDQVENLVLLHPLTGLYNLRALYVDLERQMAYARRNRLDITLMWIELRYVNELKIILTRRQFMELQQRLADYLGDMLRIEDRLYSVDDSGSFAVILTCDADGARVVKNRINYGLKTEGMLDRTMQKRIMQIDLRIAILQYDPKEIDNAVAFKQKTENELQYDV